MNVQLKQKSVMKRSLGQRISADYKANKMLVFMAIPFAAWYIIFHYAPMYGVIIAFKNYSIKSGILGSDWIGFKHFLDFFGSYSAWRVIRNTLMISLYQLIFGFPAPIILALLLNELKNVHFKKVVQTVTYLPHFISTVVICGLIINFLSESGLVNQLVLLFGGEQTNFLLSAKYFRTIYVSTSIWQGIGWNSIIYIAALSGIDMQLYEAATIDGAGRFRQLIHVTLPGIKPTIFILLIMQIGRFMSEGADKIILLYNPSTYETADIISSFVYRRGIQESSYSFSAAVGLFNSVVNIILLVSANYLSRKVNETSLW